MCREIIRDIHSLLYYDMNGEDLKSWFQNNVLENLSTDRNVIIVIGHTKYHNQLVEKKCI